MEKDTEATASFQTKIKNEVLVVYRFSIVGAVATLIHVSTVWLLITHLDRNPLLLNLAAFLVAFGFSFAGQYYWTFRSKKHWHHALLRFFSVSFFAFVLNNFVLVMLLDANLLSPAASAVLAAIVIPPFTYILGRFWAFS